MSQKNVRRAARTSRTGAAIRIQPRTRPMVQMLFEVTVNENGTGDDACASVGAWIHARYRERADRPTMECTALESRTYLVKATFYVQGRL